MLRRLGGIFNTPGTSNLIALVALFIALGGASYAAIKVPAGSVGTKQLKNNAVSGKKIKKNAVTGAKVKSGSLAAADFAAGQLPAGATGSQGETGPTGVTGSSSTAVMTGRSSLSSVNQSFAVSGISTAVNAGNESNETLSPAVPVTLGNLSVRLNTAPGALGVSRFFEVLVNDNVTSPRMFCFMADTTTSCTDTSNKPTIPASSRIEMTNNAVGGPAASIVKFSFTMGP